MNEFNMNEETLNEQLKQLISKELSLDFELQDDTKLSSIKNFDSLELLELVMLIEDKFDINIASVHNCHTYGDLLQIVKNEVITNDE